MSKKTNLKRITIDVPTDDAKWLAHYAVDADVTLSEAGRRAIATMREADPADSHSEE